MIIGEHITDMFKMLQQNNLILDHDVTMLIRGITILEGVLEKLDPSINLFQVFSIFAVCLFFVKNGKKRLLKMRDDFPFSLTIIMFVILKTVSLVFFLLV